MLFDQKSSDAFSVKLQESLRSDIEVMAVDYHINDKEFAEIATDIMVSMIRDSG